MTLDLVLLYYDYGLEYFSKDHVAGPDKNSPDKIEFYKKYGDKIKRG